MSEEKLALYGVELAEAMIAALPAWVVRSVQEKVVAQADGAIDVDKICQEAELAGAKAAFDLGDELTRLLSADIDDQRTSPLAIARKAVRYPTEVLSLHKMAPSARDGHAARLHPDDVYDLTPGGFADFGPQVAELGLTWGAAKAYVHLQRQSKSNLPKAESE